MIRIRERVIAALDDPNLDILSNPSEHDDNSKKEEEYSWERVISFAYKVEKMLWYAGVLADVV